MIQQTCEINMGDFICKIFFWCRVKNRILQSSEIWQISSYYEEHVQKQVETENTYVNITRFKPKIQKIK